MTTRQSRTDDFESFVTARWSALAGRSARRRWWGERPAEQLPELGHGGDLSDTVAERRRLAQDPAIASVALTAQAGQSAATSQTAQPSQTVQTIPAIQIYLTTQTGPAAK